MGLYNYTTMGIDEWECLECIKPISNAFRGWHVGDGYIYYINIWYKKVEFTKNMNDESWNMEIELVYYIYINLEIMKSKYGFQIS